MSWIAIRYRSRLSLCSLSLVSGDFLILWRGVHGGNRYATSSPVVGSHTMFTTSSRNYEHNTNVSDKRSIMRGDQKTMFKESDHSISTKTSTLPRRPNPSRPASLDILPLIACQANIKNTHTHIHTHSHNKQDALQVLTIVTNIYHGAAKSGMLYKCSLSHQASIMEVAKRWFTNADCRNKQPEDLRSQITSRSGNRIREQLDALPLLTVATRCATSAQCRHKHPSWSRETTACFTSAVCRNKYPSKKHQGRLIGMSVFVLHTSPSSVNQYGEP